jgi:hypothetical protein
MKRIITTSEFSDKLHHLIGKSIWATLAGGCAGTVVSIYFGAKLLRNRMCDNPMLSEEERRYEGEYTLMLYCPWRIVHGKDQIICGSGDADAEGMLITDNLDFVHDSPVEDVEVNSYLDLTISFRNGAQIHAFCEQSNVNAEYMSDSDDSYLFFVRNDEIYAVTNGSVICELTKE